MTTTTSYRSTLSPVYASDHLDASKVKYVDADGVKTRYYEDGDGPPLVLFSGGQIGSIYTLDSYSLNFDTPAKHFRVIGMDKLGEGGTAGPLTDADFTWEATVRHAQRFIEIMGLTGVHIGGHSRGGMLVSSLAYAMPDVVKSIVIIDSGTLAPSDPTTPDGGFYAALLDRIAAEGIPVPVLMLWDYNDKSAPFRWGPLLLDVIAPKAPWTEMHVFNQGGHYTFRENLEQFNRVVTGFCEQVEAHGA